MKSTAVLQTIVIGREAPAGVAPGFDLDGVNSDERDSRSCTKKDLVDADGHPGIDNQLATLMPLVDLAGQGAVEALVQNSINEGRLLLIFELERFDDGRASLTVLRGDDTPLVGTDNFVLAGQTLGLSDEAPLGATDDARIDGNMFETAPFNLRFPVVVFGLLYDLALTEARIRFTINDDGSLDHGVLGGAATIEQLFDFLRLASSQGGDFVGLLGSGVMDAGDLDRQGTACTKLSLGVTFNAVSAFTFE